MDWRWRHRLAPAGAPWRLGINGHDLVTCRNQRVETRHGEVGRPHKDNAQCHIVRPQPMGRRSVDVRGKLLVM
jgi:hypothetical protein